MASGFHTTSTNGCRSRAEPSCGTLVLDQALLTDAPIACVEPTRSTRMADEEVVDPGLLKAAQRRSRQGDDGRKKRRRRLGGIRQQGRAGHLAAGAC